MAGYVAEVDVRVAQKCSFVLHAKAPAHCVSSD